MALFGRRSRNEQEPEGERPTPSPEPGPSPEPRDERPAAGGPHWAGRALQLPIAPSPAVMPELAARIVPVTQNISGLTLRYTPDDLVTVDRILDGFAVPGSDSVAETIFTFGAYIGQTFVESAGWEWVDDDPARPMGFPWVIARGRRAATPSAAPSSASTRAARRRSRTSTR